MNPPCVSFTKATACGNDFLIIDGFDSHADLENLTRKMCDRHLGIGADGVEWLYPDSEADVRARLFNSDGVEAEISGNGTRCVAAYIYAKRNAEKIVIRTGAGIKISRLVSHEKSQYEFETGMGEPRVEKELTFPVGSDSVTGIPVSMGNPHYSMFVDNFAHGWQQIAAAVASQASFPHGVNIEIVVVKSKSDIDVRFFERGVGETQSSGTGSCAAAVAAIATGKAQSPVRVAAPGGAQTVRWQEQVFLTGPAQLICRGEYLI